MDHTLCQFVITLETDLEYDTFAQCQHEPVEESKYCLEHHLAFESRIELIGQIGEQRQAFGFPIIKVPAKFLSDDCPSDVKIQLDEIKRRLPTLIYPEIIDVPAGCKL